MIASMEKDLQDIRVELGTKWPKRPNSTKLKWVLNGKNYRVAIVTKRGILEVKAVIDGRNYCHDFSSCKCNPCEEIRLSKRLGVENPPWQRSAPLIKRFFETEAAWRDSLPHGGTVTII